MAPVETAHVKKVGVTLECISGKSGLNFRGTVSPRNSFNKMFLETIPRKLSGTKIKRYTVVLNVYLFHYFRVLPRKPCHCALLSLANPRDLM